MQRARTHSACSVAKETHLSGLLEWVYLGVQVAVNLDHISRGLAGDIRRGPRDGLDLHGDGGGADAGCWRCCGWRAVRSQDVAVNTGAGANHLAAPTAYLGQQQWASAATIVNPLRAASVLPCQQGYCALPMAGGGALTRCQCLRV